MGFWRVRVQVRPLTPTGLPVLIPNPTSVSPHRLAGFITAIDLDCLMDMATIERTAVDKHANEEM